MDDDKKLGLARPTGADTLVAHVTPDFRVTVSDTMAVPQVPDDLPVVERSTDSDSRLPTGMHETGMLGRFNILDILGAGGMGVVLAAYDPQLDRKVAIKVLRTRGLTGRRREKEAARLLREARSMAQLSHPHVVTVYEAGTIDDRVYVAMEYIPGQTLRSWLAERKRTVAEILDAYLKAGRGLAAGHAAGLIHRDFKPDNVLVGFDGRVRVIDFGLARPTRQTVVDTADTGEVGEDEPSPAASFAPGIQLTTVGTLFGTPMYMAPEQHKKQELDARADQFAFCVSLFEGLYGRVPFPAQSYLELAEAVTGGKIKMPEENPAIPGHVTAAVLRGLRPDPDQRFLSMDELLDELAPSPRRRRGLVIASTAVGAAAAVAITLAVVGMTSSHAPAVVDPCTGGADRFANVWDDPVKERVRTAFLATKRSHAGETLTRVFDELDRYKDEWNTRRREVCQATAGEPSMVADTREQCLNEQLDVVHSLTQLFAKADGNSVDNSTAAVRGLMPLKECMSARPGAKPTALQTTQLAGLEADLGEVVALLKLSRFARAETLARELLARAEPIGYPYVTAELKFWLATAQMGTTKIADAERTLRETLPVAARAKHDQMVARIWTYLIWVIGQQRTRYAEALALVPVAEVALVRADANALRGDLEYNLGVVHFNNADYKHANEHFEASIKLYDEEYGEHEIGAPKRYSSLGGSYLRSGNLFAAKASFEKALAITEKVHGPAHPDAAVALSALGGLAQAMNDFEKATQLHRRALAILEETLGPDHEQVGQLVYSLAVSANGREDYRGAVPLYERALHIFERLAPDHPYVGLALVGLADCREEIGDFARAADEAERGYKLVSAQKSDPGQLALAQYVLAKALWSANRDRARALQLAVEAHKGFSAGGLAYLNAIAAVEKWFAKTGTRPP